MFFELREYRCLPGQRENWVRFMEEQIIPFQVAKGMVIVGSFVGLGQTACPTGYPYYTLLGPAATARPRPSAMPGAIAEPLFLTHPGEAALAANFDVREALAVAYARALHRFLDPAAE